MSHFAYNKNTTWKEVADLFKWQYTSNIIMMSGLTLVYGIQI